MSQNPDDSGPEYAICPYCGERYDCDDQPFECPECHTPYCMGCLEDHDCAWLRPEEESSEHVPEQE